MGASRDLFIASCFQGAGCVAAAIVLVMAVQSGAVLQQQINRSVRIDSKVHDDGMDIAGAAKKLDGMLVAGLVLLLLNVPLCICTLFSSTAWLALALERYVASAFCVQIGRQAGTWAAFVERFPWDVPIGGLWFILYALLWLFTRVAGVWINNDTAMGLVLLDGVACTRCPTECGCEFETAKDALQGTVTLLRASYWIAGILSVVSACAVKAMVQNEDGRGAVSDRGLQRSAVGYSALPVVAAKCGRSCGRASAAEHR